MSRDERRRQASLERKAARRKRKQEVLREHAVPSSPRALLRSAANWPLHECLISRNWNVEGELVEVLVARRSASGEITAGSFLVDLCCLGVKNAFVRLFASELAYEERLRKRMMDGSALASADFNLAAKVIREGIAYARRLGFSPHPDYYESAVVLLEGADPDSCRARVSPGKDGKPFFVAGPYDDALRIMVKLEKVVRPGNFDFLIFLGDPPRL